MSTKRIRNQKTTLSDNRQQTLCIAESVSAETSAYAQGPERKTIEHKFKNLMHEEPRWGSLVSYVGNKNFPFLRIYRYKEAFSTNFVKELLKNFEAGEDDYVLDPFSGLGTTVFTSFICNVSSVGLDKLPIAYFISKTMPTLLFLKPHELTDIWTSIIPKIPKKKLADVALDVPIMKIAFDQEILTTLRKLKTAIDELPKPYSQILLLLFFSILEECSFTSKDGQFLRMKPDKKISKPIEALTRKVAEVESDIRHKMMLFPDLVMRKKNAPNVYLGDTRNLSVIKFKKKPTIIITSPPYLNRYDYTRTYSLELCFHFVKSFEELKAIRFGILRSHIESKIGRDEGPCHPVIEEVLNALARKKLNNPKIPSMIVTYFIDMRTAIREWFEVLTPGAKLAIVVDNVRFEGELIPVDLVLCEMAEEIGFRVKDIGIARYKGNSSQQMRKYGKVPVRESVLFWEK